MIYLLLIIYYFFILDAPLALGTLIAFDLAPLLAPWAQLALNLGPNLPQGPTAVPIGTVLTLDLGTLSSSRSLMAFDLGF